MAQSSIAPGGAIFTETFIAPTLKPLYDKMDARRDELAAAGHTGFTRRAIGRNALCPCGSRLKFKKCCIARSR
jgi:uncharacterized protein YecA (UPF0149 family)